MVCRLWPAGHTGGALAGGGGPAWCVVGGGTSTVQGCRGGCVFVAGCACCGAGPVAAGSTAGGGQRPLVKCIMNITVAESCGALHQHTGKRRMASSGKAWRYPLNSTKLSCEATSTCGGPTPLTQNRQCNRSFFARALWRFSQRVHLGHNIGCRTHGSVVVHRPPVAIDVVERPTAVVEAVAHHGGRPSVVDGDEH